jgi:hypothetical protein
MEIFYFDNADKLKPTDGLELRVPGNAEEAILVHCNPKFAPASLLLAIRVGIGRIEVSRADEQPIQVVDASPGLLAANYPNRAFRLPLETVAYQRQVFGSGESEAAVWRLDTPRELIANPPIVQTFSDLICRHSLTKQQRGMANSNDI